MNDLEKSLLERISVLEKELQSEREHIDSLRKIPGEFKLGSYGPFSDTLREYCKQLNNLRIIIRGIAGCDTVRNNRRACRYLEKAFDKGKLIKVGDYSSDPLLFSF